MNKLTSREKKLILFVVALGLVMGAMFLGIFPLYNNWIGLQDEHDALLIQKDELNQKLAMRALTLIQYERAQEKLEETKEKNRYFMDKADCINLLTDLTRKSGLRSGTVNVSDAKPYSADPKKKSSDLTDAAIYTATATLTVTGGYDNIKKLIDEVDRLGYVRINKISFSAKDAMDTAAETQISLILEIMMLDKNIDDLGAAAQPEKEDGGA